MLSLALSLSLVVMMFRKIAKNCVSKKSEMSKRCLSEDARLFHHCQDIRS
jgi:hypothetical protein